MWKSGSVVGLQVRFILWYNEVLYYVWYFYQQIAGAKAGKKGDEFSNMILSLTPTVKISLARVFNEMATQIRGLENGFQAFDCFTGRIETVSRRLFAPTLCLIHFMLRLKYLFVQPWLTFQLKASYQIYIYYFLKQLFVAEVTPLKGYRADVFCARDMLNKSTGQGFGTKRDLALLRAQVT